MYLSYRLLVILFLGSITSIAGQEPEEQSQEILEAGPTTPGQPVALPLRLPLVEALMYTLENQLELKISLLNIRAQQGVAQNLAGPFDPLFGGFVSQEFSQDLQSTTTTVPVKTDFNGYTTTTEVRAIKKTRLGTLLSASAQIQRIDDILVFRGVTNTATISFKVDQPLLRNLWLGPDTVNEEAAWLELWAVYMDGLQSTARHILDTTVQYWELVAAKKFVDISLDAEERFKRLTENIQRLIDEEQLARVDIVQAYEKIVAQQLDTLQLKQQMYSVFEILKLTMGDVQIDPWDEENPYVLDDFTGALPEAQELLKITPELIDQAMTYRYDIQAAAIREREANLLLQGAYNEELPLVNVFGGVSKTDFDIGKGSEDYFSSMELRRPETDWTIGINVSVPLYNDFAKGLVRQRQSEKYQSTLETQFLTQSSITALRTAISNQLSLLRQFKKAKERVDLTREQLEDEWKKLRAGYSTLFVVLDFESRVTDALNEYVLIGKQYMQNVANLRFLTGSLFESDACLSIVALEDVTTLPGI